MYSAAQESGRTFLDEAPRDISDAVAREVMSGAYARVPNPRRTLDEALRTLKVERLRTEQEGLERELKDAERRGDRERARALLIRQVETRKQAEELKRRPEEPR
jgi:hypothetical protein